jgi:hypothetical protein
VESGHLRKLVDKLGRVERGYGALAAHRDRAPGCDDPHGPWGLFGA